MKFTKSVLALSLLSFSTEAFATDYTWTHLGGDQYWETNGNWNPNNAYPNSVTDAAIFPPDLVGYSVFIGNSKTINSISFDSATVDGAYLISDYFDLGEKITFGGTTPFITLTKGTHTIDAGLIFAADTTINLNSTDASSLTFSGSGSFTQSGTRTLTFTGPGTAIYNYTGLPQVINSIVLNNGADLTVTGILISLTPGSATLEANSFTINSGTITLGKTGSSGSDRGILQSDTGSIAIGANGKITSLYEGQIILPNSGSGELTIANGGRLEMGVGSGVSHTGIIRTQNGSDAILITNSGSVAPVSGTSTTPSQLYISSSSQNTTYHQTLTGVLDVYLDTSLTDSQLSNIGANNFILDPGSKLNVHVVDTTGIASLQYPLLPVLSANNGSGSISGTFSTINLIGSLPAGISMTPYYNVDAYTMFGLLFSGGSPSPTPSPSINTSITSYVGGSNQAVFTSVNNSNIRLGRQMQRVRGNFSENLSRPSPNANPVAVSFTFNTEGLLVDSNEKINLQAQDSATKSRKTPANFYMGAISNTGDINKKSGQTGFDYWSAGALAGFDYAFSQVGVGILTSYERTDAHIDASWGKFTIDQFHASLYVCSTAASSDITKYYWRGRV